MHYLDANVFVYAALDEGELGAKARESLRRAVKERACTCTLTVDEVLWAIKRLQGRQVAGAAARRLLQLDMVLYPVEKQDVDAALVHFRTGLDPRDAIHAAVAVRRGCQTLISTDPAFAELEGIEHLHLA